MTNVPRYAIYYAPSSDSALHRFGSTLLGYDAASGDDLPFPVGVMADWRDVTQDPRKYGFHATLKAPTALADGRNEAELLDACAAFAGRARRIPLIEPVVDAISGFIAVIPASRSTRRNTTSSSLMRWAAAGRQSRRMGSRAISHITAITTWST